MNDILVAYVKSVHGEPELGMITLPKTQVVAEPLPCPRGIMGKDKQMLKKTKCHFTSSFAITGLQIHELRTKLWEFVEWHPSRVDQMIMKKEGITSLEYWVEE